MQKALLTVGVMALFGAVLSAPAAAQMCGSGQQAQASTPAGGMMCGGAMGAAADDPMADKPAQTPKASGMCACCGKMAMMKGATDDHKNMPGMQMK